MYPSATPVHQEVVSSKKNCQIFGGAYRYFWLSQMAEGIWESVYAFYLCIYVTNTGENSFKDEGSILAYGLGGLRPWPMYLYRTRKSLCLMN